MKTMAPEKAHQRSLYHGFWVFAYLFSLILQASIAGGILWPRHPIDATVYDVGESYDPGMNIISQISYDQLPPPPSLMDMSELPPTGLTEGTVGDAPLPVPDELAEQNTLVDTDIGTTLPISGDGNVQVVENITDPNQLQPVFIAYDTAPEFLTKGEPEYPAIGREGGVEGVVQLMVYVSADGKVKNVVVTSPMAISAFNEAAVSAAYQCTFKPATSGGQPIGVWLALPMYFHLQ